MAYKGVGFQQAVDELKSFNGASVPAAKTVIKQVQELPTENQPFKGSYEKFAVQSTG
jgi:hypothetical protein